VLKAAAWVVVNALISATERAVISVVVKDVMFVAVVKLMIFP
jgi:hypothetical protein